jgi:hypothetical protein
MLDQVPSQIPSEIPIPSPNSGLQATGLEGAGPSATVNPPSADPHLRTRLAASIAAEKHQTTKRNKIAETRQRLTDIINDPANQSPKAALETLEAAYQNRYQDWATNGATGPPPVRDETKFATAENAVRKAETRMADAQTAIQTLDAEFQNPTDLETAASTTTDLIQQIQLEECETLFQQAADTIALLVSIWANIRGLPMALSPASRGNSRLIGTINNLLIRLEATMLLPLPTDAQCQAAKQSWAQNDLDLRTDPQATFTCREELQS